jgi:hypothetical protein
MSLSPAACAKVQRASCLAHCRKAARVSGIFFIAEKLRRSLSGGAQMIAQLRRGFDLLPFSFWKRDLVVR